MATIDTAEPLTAVRFPLGSQPETARDDGPSCRDFRRGLVGLADQCPRSDPAATAGDSGAAPGERAAPRPNSPPWRQNWPTCASGSAVTPATLPNRPPATARVFSRPSGAKAVAASGVGSRAILDQGPSCCRSSALTRWSSTTLPPAAAAAPYRHQVLEIPPITPLVIEHRLHRLVCPCCSTSTCAELPSDVEPSRYGPRLSALVVLLSSAFPLQFRQNSSAARSAAGGGDQPRRHRHDSEAPERGPGASRGGGTGAGQAAAGGLRG